MIILVEMTKRLAKVIVRVSATGCRMWPEIKMPAFPLPFFEREREKERERERGKKGWTVQGEACYCIHFWLLQHLQEHWHQLGYAE